MVKSGWSAVTKLNLLSDNPNGCNFFLSHSTAHFFCWPMALVEFVRNSLLFKILFFPLIGKTGL